MNNLQQTTIDQMVIDSLKGQVPDEHVNKLNQWVKQTKKDFSSVFGESTSAEKTVNQLVGIEINVWSDKVKERQVISTALRVREPIDWGPKPRKPVRCGGSKCITIKIGDYTYTVCIDWEGPCNTVAF